MINAKGEEDSGRTYVNTNSVKVNSKYSLVIPGTNTQSLTGAHELGHLLGIKGHIDNTLMSTSPDSNRTSSITQEQINAIVESEKGHNDFMSSFFLWINQLFK